MASKRIDELDLGTPVSGDFAVFSATGGPSKKCTITDFLALAPAPGPGIYTIVNITATTYTFVLSDGQKLVVFNPSATATYTIPPV